MPSVVGAIPKAGLDGVIPEWFRLDWPPEILHGIYRDWGTYYFNRRRETFAQYYFNLALQLEPDDYPTLYRRSQAKRKAAEIDGALQDAKVAAKMALDARGPNVLINGLVCDALFELNQFENSMSEMYNNVQIFEGVKVETFKKRLIVLEEIINDITGEALSIFFLKNQKLVGHVSEILRAKEFVDTRPLWKILRDQGKCDVLSIPEVEEVLLSPLEMARRKRAFNVVLQNYLNDAWFDVLFTKNLRTNPNLLLNQCKYSKQFLFDFLNKQYNIVWRFIKMIHTRSPLYFLSFVKFSNRKMLENFREAYLYRVQYQTHRNMLADLKQIRKLREEKKIKALAQYVERVMGDYYVTKTTRVMCWKFEFINEVYNIFALALSEQYYVPKRYRLTPRSMWQLLYLPEDKIKDIVPFVFGDRSTYQEGDPDAVAAKTRKYLGRLELRLRFAKYSIEKCYLYHQLASGHLMRGGHDECCFNARKAIREARSCNNMLWEFLSIILIIKANTMLYKVERTKEALEEALPLTERMQNPVLIKFIDLCLYATEEAYTKKVASISSRMSKVSGGGSVHSN